MADRWAVASGNWSSTATWNGGTLPTAADDVFADGFTVTIDQDVTVLSIRNTQRTGGTNGGSFTLNAGRTVSATGLGFIGSTTTCINFTASGSPSVLNGNCRSDGAGATVYNNTSGNTLTINGNITNNQGSASPTIDCNNNGTTIINGSVTGSPFANGMGVRAQGNTFCLLTINGNVTGGNGSQAFGLYIHANPIITIIGNVTGGTVSQAHGISTSGSGAPSVAITGSVTSGTASTCHGINIGNSLSPTITGNVTGGGLLLTGSCGISIGGNPIGLILNGNAIAGNGSGGTCHAITGGGSSSLFQINGNLVASANAAGLSTSSAVRHLSGSILNASNGNQALVGPTNYTVHASNPMTVSNRVITTLVERLFYTANAMPSSITPTASDVRSGVSYASGERTGTLIIPSSQFVSLGTPVDSGVGTLQYLTMADLQSALAPNAPVIAERSDDDTKALTFSWPVSGVPVSGFKSFDNGAYSSVSGAISYLRTEGARHYYTLAYNAADRSTQESLIRYRMQDGTYTKYFNLRIMPATNSEVIAIKAKTDNLPADPASSSQITSLLNNAPMEAF